MTELPLNHPLCQMKERNRKEIRVSAFFTERKPACDFQPAETGFYDIYPADRRGKEPLPSKEKKYGF